MTGTSRSAVATIAHRGASASAPENTLAAVRAAVAVGASAVEIDVRRTRDGALVVLHDDTLDRTTDIGRRLPGRARTPVGRLSLDEVRSVDAGSWHSPWYAGERVPLLTEVVDVLRGTGTGLLLEVKNPGDHPGIEADVVAELRGVPGYLADALSAGQLVVESFDHACMLRLKQADGRIPVGLLGAPARRRLDDLATWAHQVNPRLRAARPAYVEAVQEAGMTCHVWTVDAPADMARLVSLGVDGVITNRPETLLDLLGERVGSAA